MRTTKFVLTEKTIKIKQTKEDCQTYDAGYKWALEGNMLHYFYILGQGNIASEQFTKGYNDGIYEYRNT